MVAPIVNATIHACGSFTNFLDLQCIFVNTFAGDNTIFLISLALVALIVMGWFRMPIGAVGAGITIAGLLVEPISPALYYICIFFALILVGFSIAKAVNR